MIDSDVASYSLLESRGPDVGEWPRWTQSLRSRQTWRSGFVLVLSSAAAGGMALAFNELDALSSKMRARLLGTDHIVGGLFVLPDGAAHTRGMLICMGSSIVGIWLIVLLRDRVFPGTQGTGIPTVMAALRVEPASLLRHAMLSWRIALGKSLLLGLAFFCNASIGREGPTVHVGACVIHLACAQCGAFPAWVTATSAPMLAGGAAGVAAAFNAPVAGVVFAIEELAGAFNKRAVALSLTAVGFACLVNVALLGNYLFYGSVHPSLSSPAQASSRFDLALAPIVRRTIPRCKPSLSLCPWSPSFGRSGPLSRPSRSSAAFSAACSRAPSSPDRAPSGARCPATGTRSRSRSARAWHSSGSRPEVRTIPSSELQ